MVDTQELNEFAKLPVVFTNEIEWEIHKVVSEYAEYRSHIARELENHGGHFGYKISEVYDKVEKMIIDNEKDAMKARKFLTVLATMRRVYCKEGLA